MDSQKTTINNLLNTPEDFTLHQFLYKLTKKDTGRCQQHKRVQLMEEDALLLCHLLIKEGYFDINDVNGCTVCAIQNLEKKIMRQMKQQMDIVKNARHYYSQPENAKFYKLCPRHRAKNGSGNHDNHTNQTQRQPSSQPQPAPQPHPKPQRQPQPHTQPQFVQPPPILISCEPPKYFIPYPIPAPQLAFVPEPVPYYPLIHAVIPQISFDSFIPIPWGIDPMCYMFNYNEWVKYLQQFYGTRCHKRMPYTNNIPLEITEDRKTVGRRFV